MDINIVGIIVVFVVVVDIPIVVIVHVVVVIIVHNTVVYVVVVVVVHVAIVFVHVASIILGIEEMEKQKEEEKDMWGKERERKKRKECDILSLNKDNIVFWNHENDIVEMLYRKLHLCGICGISSNISKIQYNLMKKYIPNA